MVCISFVMMDLDEKILAIFLCYRQRIAIGYIFVLAVGKDVSKHPNGVAYGFCFHQTWKNTNFEGVFLRKSKNEILDIEVAKLAERQWF